MESMIKVALVLTLFLGCVACRADEQSSGDMQTGTDAQSESGQQRMNSLSVTRAGAVNREAAPGIFRTRSIAGGATGAQFQTGAGNSQSMYVNASGGNVTQRQSGTGNSQSMNIGVVDNSPAGGDIGKRNQ